MKAFTVHNGKTVPIMEDNINTDQILPSAYLNRIGKTGYGQFLFDNWRYLSKDPKEPNPDFILNHPERDEASILVTGDNFAGGSSREHAVWALLDYGFRVVIAGGFSDIFYMNSLKNGLLALTLPLEERQELACLDSQEEITVDLENQILRTKDKVYTFEIEEVWRKKLLEGIDDITETMAYSEAIENYEKKWDSFYAVN